VKLADIQTPALVVDHGAFSHNVRTMAHAHPKRRLRPHVKAFKSTALARELHDAGHTAFCCATVREVEGMAAAGLGADLLLANEVLDCTRLGALVAADAARVTVAVDSPETIDAVVRGGVREVLIDVAVGMPRCGCDPAQAGALAELARSQGLEVRGVMGYEGHLMREGSESKAQAVEASMKLLRVAAEAVGGDVVSGGGTGTWDTNRWITELQAGSYCLMDTEYVPHAPAFRNALYLWTTVISVNQAGWAVLDAGLKAHGMDHGDPRVVDAGDVWFVSDEHITFGTRPEHPVRVGDKVAVLPAHVDPTVAMHERMYVVEPSPHNSPPTPEAAITALWPVDLRGW
jgi:D-serine deaminase-like pyridoxal phosphate-dependent protein